METFIEASMCAPIKVNVDISNDVGDCTGVSNDE
jgi:hypothetical protein